MDYSQHWLTPEEKAYIIEALVEYGIIIHDPDGNLPLKSGGTTDIYVNLRDARNWPILTSMLANDFCKSLRVAGCFENRRLAEVPHAVSPLAGVISTRTGIPLVTVRDQEKPGRVTKGKLIGTVNKGDRIILLDDVITDGASKVPALEELTAAGASDIIIMVLVDRNDGWREHLARLDWGHIPVWAGMRLADIRDYLHHHHKK